MHLLLCEADPPTANDIERWLSGLDKRSTSFELYRGDWRARFAEPFPIGWDAYCFSFDPNMYERHDVQSPKPENMYSSDIDLLRGAIRQLPEAPIVVQLSTYSVNGGNSQPDVFESLVVADQRALAVGADGKDRRRRLEDNRRAAGGTGGAESQNATVNSVF